MLFSLVAWGDWHIDMLLRFGLPSLLREGNFRVGEDTLHLHTRERDRAKLRYAPLPEGTKGLLIPDGYDTRMMTVQLWRQDAFENPGRVAFIWPDVVWGAGVFDVYRRLLDAGCCAVFNHLPRVDAEAADWIESFEAPDNRTLARIALTFESHLSACHHVDSPSFPDHTELVTWRIPHGRLTRLMSHLPACYDTRIASLNVYNLLNNQGVIGMPSDSDNAIALSLTKSNHDLSWVTTGRDLTPARIRAWTKLYPCAVNAALAQLSYRLHDRDVAPEIWAGVEAEANRLVDDVFNPNLEG